MRYAQHTNVSVERSESEIKSMLIRYGASEFASGWVEGKAMIQFHAYARKVRFILPLPNLNDDIFKFKSYGGEINRTSPRRADDAMNKWEQACRQRWRALALAIKAKLEAVESGITSFEEEFYAHIVLPGGKTMYQMTGKQVEIAYQTKKIPPLLDFKE